MPDSTSSPSREEITSAAPPNVNSDGVESSFDQKIATTKGEIEKLKVGRILACLWIVLSLVAIAFAVLWYEGALPRGVAVLLPKDNPNIVPMPFSVLTLLISLGLLVLAIVTTINAIIRIINRKTDIEVLSAQKNMPNNLPGAVEQTILKIKTASYINKLLQNEDKIVEIKVKIFISYAREDETLVKNLETHLEALKRENIIDVWYDQDISAGEDWQKEISQHLETAQIVLLGISPDFIASDYCYSNEMQRAMERHEQGETRVIPIILRPVLWQNTPFAKLQALPKEAKPVKSWENTDDAFLDIIQSIQKVAMKMIALEAASYIEQKQNGLSSPASASTPIRTLTNNMTKEQFLQMGSIFNERQDYEEAFDIYEQVLQLDPNDTTAYLGKAIALNGLKRYEDALIYFKQCIRLNLNNASAYYGKGEALYFLMQYAEAFEAYEQAVRLDPSVSVRVQEITALKKKYKDWLNKYSKLLYIYIIIPIIIFILGIILSSNGLLLVISIGLFFGIFGINFAREILDFMYARHIYNKMSKTLQAESATLQTGRDD